MRLNAAGQVATQCWQAIPDHFLNVRCDEFVVMPNHIHGILWIIGPDPSGVGANNYSPLRSPRRLAGHAPQRLPERLPEPSIIEPDPAGVGANDYSPLRSPRRPSRHAPERLPERLPEPSVIGPDPAVVGANDYSPQHLPRHSPRNRANDDSPPTSAVESGAAPSHIENDRFHRPRFQNRCHPMDAGE